jgi:hypothetical protein
MKLFKKHKLYILKLLVNWKVAILENTGKQKVCHSKEEWE